MSLTREQSREVDRRALAELGLPGVVLMENAGRSASNILARLHPSPGRAVVCCAKGNNGGDGLVLARWLGLRGVPCDVLLFGRPQELAGDAAVMFRALRFSPVAITIADGDPTAALDRLAGASVVVDALFGTGLTGPVRPPFDRIITAMNASGVPVVALDIPSGLDCDTGEPLGPTIRAAHTITFVDRKRGFDTPTAAAWTGEIHIAEIGLPLALVEAAGGE